MELRSQAIELLAREAWLLDTRSWREWLSLYTEDAVFWVPCWLDDDEVATDHTRQLSFIYVEGRAGLQERIAKATDPRAPASLPMPRTAHQLGPVMVDSTQNSLITRCAWQTLIFDPKGRRSSSYAGRYEHHLSRGTDGTLAIRRKTVTVINDEIDSKLDFFCI
jgi:3-phenylpropionate/cinnamic acid dioxygenase small subunit